MSVITRSGGPCAPDHRARFAPGPLAPGASVTSHARERHARVDAGDPDHPREGARDSSRPPNPQGVSPAVLKRIALLPTRDRAIVELTLRSNLSRSGIARALGITAGQVSRRLHRLYARLHDPLVISLTDPRCPLAPEYRQLGVERHLLGFSVPQLADQHRIPQSEVRRMLAYLRGWQKGVSIGRT